MPHPLSVCTRLTIALLTLLTHSLTLTIMMGLFMTCLATRPLWHALVWALLLVGWTITIILLDWGLRWYFITSVLSCIRPPPHHDISLESFGMPSQSTRTPPSSTTTELHFIYTASSQEPLDPGVQDDQATQLPYCHAHDPTAPIPDYDPTARAQYEWEKSWARKPVSPPVQGLEQRIVTDIESQPLPPFTG